jgi:hypothetical protein
LFPSSIVDSGTSLKNPLLRYERESARRPKNDSLFLIAQSLTGRVGSFQFGWIPASRIAIPSRSWSARSRSRN